MIALLAEDYIRRSTLWLPEQARYQSGQDRRGKMRMWNV
jgi:hypothetical protein